MDKIRVLVLCMEDPEVMIGGRGTYVKEIYRSMAERDDVEIELLTCGPGIEPKEYNGYMKYTSDKLICWKPNVADITSNLVSDIQMMRTLAKWIATGRRWDLVHIHDWDTVQVGRLVRDALGIPLLGSIHLSLSAMIHDTHAFGIKLPTDTLYCMQQEGHLVVDSDRIMTCSREYARSLSDVFMTDRPIDVIYNGIRPEEWHPGAGMGSRAISKEKLSTERPLLLFVGRITEMKGIRPLLKAIDSGDNGYQLVIVGEVNANTERERDEWDVTRTIRRIESHYPERLRWVGFRTGQDLLDLYSAADVGIMPSTHEPFGIVALEHMAMGIPLIATEVGGLREIVVDENGDEYAMIIRPRSEDILAALDVLKDRGVRETLAASGLERVKAFTWETAAQKTVSIYKEELRV